MKLTVRVASIHAHDTSYFPANGSTNPDDFSLKPSPSHGESSLKISARWGSPFRRSSGTSKQTDRLTHWLTDWCFYRVMYSLKNNTLLSSSPFSTTPLDCMITILINIIVSHLVNKMFNCNLFSNMCDQRWYNQDKKSWSVWKIKSRNLHLLLPSYYQNL